MNAIKNIWHSFPLQLLLMHIRKDQIFLLFWGLLLITITQQIGKGMGFPYLFLDPEYLQQTNVLSFYIVGLSFGGFVVTWNLVSYLLNSRKYHFLAALESPFAVYFVNNSVLPIAFTLIYLVCLILFQSAAEYVSAWNIFFKLAGFVGGTFSMILISALYLYLTNTNAPAIAIRKKQESGKSMHISKHFLSEDDAFDRKRWKKPYRVSNYLGLHFKWRISRDTEHYPEHIKGNVLKQHHYNALIIQMCSLILLFLLGFFMENKLFQIPSAACLFLLFAVLVSLTGFIRYWTGPWASTAVILLLAAFNYLSLLGFMNWDNQAFGISYEQEKQVYSYERLQQLSSDSVSRFDQVQSMQILDAWKARQKEEKPKLVIINSSGGGFRSAYFSMRILQQADSLSQGALMEQTQMMSGASGGSFALAYYRELYYRQLQKEPLNRWDRRLADELTEDLVNPISIAILTNDMFYPLHKVKVGEHNYRVDRGYLMEHEFNRNTHQRLNKAMGDYKEPERRAEIPMLIGAATITNDMRKLIMSPQPLSYLMRPLNRKGGKELEIDAVDYGRLLNTGDASDLRMSSMLRMNASYPYLLPAVSLPTDPMIRLYDAGIVDNFGTELSVRYMLAMKNWIDSNTSGVVLVQIIDHNKFEVIRQQSRQSYLSKLLNPAGMFYSNISIQQDYDFDYLLDMSADLLQKPLHVVRFEYDSPPEKRASITLRLTKREKADIELSLHSEHNRNAFQQLNSLLSVEAEKK